MAMGSSDNRITGYEPIWLLCECDQLGPRQHNVQPLAGDCDENASVAAHTGAAVALPHRCHGSAIGWSRTLPGAAGEGDCALWGWRCGRCHCAYRRAETVRGYWCAVLCGKSP